MQEEARDAYSTYDTSMASMNIWTSSRTLIHSGSSLDFYWGLGSVLYFGKRWGSEENMASGGANQIVASGFDFQSSPAE